MIRDTLRLHEVSGSDADYKRGYEQGKFYSRDFSTAYVAQEKDINKQKAMVQSIVHDDTIKFLIYRNQAKDESERYKQGFKDGFRDGFLKRLQHTSLSEALEPTDDEKDILGFLQGEAKQTKQEHDTRVTVGLLRRDFTQNYGSHGTAGRKKLAPAILFRGNRARERGEINVVIVYRLQSTQHENEGIEVDIFFAQDVNPERYTWRRGNPPHLTASDFREESLTEALTEAENTMVHQLSLFLKKLMQEYVQDPNADMDRDPEGAGDDTHFVVVVHRMGFLRTHADYLQHFEQQGVKAEKIWERTIEWPIDVPGDNRTTYALIRLSNGGHVWLVSTEPETYEQALRSTRPSPTLWYRESPHHESLIESPVSPGWEDQVKKDMDQFAAGRSYRMFPAMQESENLAHRHGFHPAGDQVAIEHEIHSVTFGIHSLIGIHLMPAMLRFGKGHFDGADVYVLAFEIYGEPGNPAVVPSTQLAPSQRNTWIRMP